MLSGTERCGIIMKKSIAFILLGVVCFCIFYGIRYLENPVETQTVISEVYENKIDTSGYIVRTEQVYNAPVSGTVYHYIQEGTRVGRNRVLSTVYTGGISQQTLQELNNINKKLAELENSGTDASYMAGSASSEEDIENIKNNIIKAKTEHNIAKISDYKAQINAIITGSVQNTQGQSVDELTNRKNALESSMNSLKNDLYSQMSGVFSGNVDGLEGILTPRDVMSYKVADYENIAEKAKEYKTTATSGEPVCKVVNNHTWYVMMTVDKETAQGLKNGRKVKLRFGYLPGIEADATLEYISTENSETDKNVIVVKCEQYKEGVYSLRFSKIELILESYEGYRIPVSALRVHDGVKGVLVKNAGAQLFKPCNVVYTDTVGGTVIISPVSGTQNMLRDYDCIVVGEK